MDPKIYCWQINQVNRALFINQIKRQGKISNQFRDGEDELIINTLFSNWILSSGNVIDVIFTRDQKIKVKKEKPIFDIVIAVRNTFQHEHNLQISISKKDESGIGFEFYLRHSSHYFKRISKDHEHILNEYIWTNPIEHLIDDFHDELQKHVDMDKIRETALDKSNRVYIHH
ncbi:MAG: hypothetical protein ACFB14_06335 [Leptolyngbyaceae cyanobacterium]